MRSSRDLRTPEESSTDLLSKSLHVRSKGIRGNGRVRIGDLLVGNGLMEMGVMSQLHIIILDSKQTTGVIEEEFQDVLHILPLVFA